MHFELYDLKSAADFKIFIHNYYGGETRMKQDHARNVVLDLWNTVKNDNDYNNYPALFQSVRSFYNNLQNQNPELLTFRHLGDKWPVINCWVLTYEREE